MKYKTTETTFFTEQTNTNADFLWVLVHIFGMYILMDQCQDLLSLLHIVDIQLAVSRCYFVVNLLLFCCIV